MEPEFTTTSGKLRIRGTVISHHKLVDDVSSRYRFHSFILLALLLWFFITRVVKDDPSRWMSGMILAFLMYPHMAFLVQKLFIETFRRKIDARDIREVIILESENTLDETLIIRLKPSRQKRFSFRVLENQLEPFVTELARLNPSAIISR